MSLMRMMRMTGTGGEAGGEMLTGKGRRKGRWTLVRQAAGLPLPARWLAVGLWSQEAFGTSCRHR